MSDKLIERLRQAAAECSGWDGFNPPFTEWSDLMDEAATAIDTAAREMDAHRAFYALTVKQRDKAWRQIAAAQEALS